MKVYIYGIAGIDDGYRIVRYDKIDGDFEPISIITIKNRARTMKRDYPWIKDIYAIDASPQLAMDFKKRGTDEIVKTVHIPNTLACAVGYAGIMAMYGCVIGVASGLIMDVKAGVKAVFKKK